MLILKLCLTILLCSIQKSNSAKILGVFHIPSKSHHILGSALLKELAQRGHEVTMVSAFPLKSPVKNYRDIELVGLMQYMQGSVMKELLSNTDITFIEKFFQFKEFIKNMNELCLNNTNVIKLINSGEQFDVVIQSWAWSEVLLGLAHQFGAHSMAFSTVGPSFMTNSITCNPSPYSYISNPFLHFPKEMTFWQRVANTVINIFQEFVHYTIISPDQKRLLSKHFPNAPSLNELLENVSLVLLNSHYSIQNPHPLVPSMVEIGGFHISDKRKKLPADINTFLDAASEGAILFSLGSNVKSADLPKDKLQNIIKSFSKLPVKVLWKYENDNIEVDTSKVLIKKWLPQTDVLAHRNMKAFVTHGGLLSTTEAIYHGIPLIGIPVFGDQDSNILEAVEKGFAIKVDFNNLTEDSLTDAINEVLQNSKYRQSAQQVSKLLNDQPIKPMDKAVYWVEYVLNHNGAHHLKTSALKLWGYQYFLLDVIMFLAVIVTTLIIVCCKVLKSIRNYYRTIFNKLIQQ